jgi:enediyne biosynthesis protein E4
MGGVAGDFNGDGFEDVFLAQNFFATRPNDERLDAGRGLLLLGNGRGDFTPVDSHAAGIAMLGAQTSPLASDFQRSGKLDLVVGQNSAAAQLFRNRGAQTGVRIQLRGPAGNPDGIGAQLRPKYPNRNGATRDIECASGPNGQNSFVQIFGGPDRPIAVRIVWPGGKVAEYPLPSNADFVTIDFQKGIVLNDK